MKKSNYLLIGLILCLSMYVFSRDLSVKYNKADLIIFSFDRPLQLYALLESVEHYYSNIGQTRVIFRYSNEEFLEGYEEVQKRFAWTQFVAQSPITPHNDFKQLTMDALYQTPNDYVLFSVDDIIVTDFVDLASCIEALEKYTAYGFYLRLGKNITYSYLGDRDIPIPDLQEVDDDIYCWRFGASKRHWAWSNSLDMVIYHKSEIIDMFERLTVHHAKGPNTLEAFWMGNYKVPCRTGLCYGKSKMVNIPVNLVQDVWKTRHSNSFSIIELLDIFNQNKKIDISQLYQYNNISVHEEIPFAFVDCTL